MRWLTLSSHGSADLCCVREPAANCMSAKPLSLALTGCLARLSGSTARTSSPRSTRTRPGYGPVTNSRQPGNACRYGCGPACSGTFSTACCGRWPTCPATPCCRASVRCRHRRSLSSRRGKPVTASPAVQLSAPSPVADCVKRSSCRPMSTGSLSRLSRRAITPTMQLSVCCATAKTASIV